MERCRLYGSVHRATVPSVNSLTRPATVPAVLSAHPRGLRDRATTLGPPTVPSRDTRHRVAARRHSRRSLYGPPYHAGTGDPRRAYAGVLSESLPSHARAIRRLIRGIRDPIGRHPNKLGIRGLHADRPDRRGPRRRAVRPSRLHAHIVLGRRRGGARLHGDLRVHVADGEIGRRRCLGHADRRRENARHDGAHHKSTRHVPHEAPPESSHNPTTTHFTTSPAYRMPARVLI